jgi:hypothetical protein
MREKERGNATILLPHLCFEVAPYSSLESLLSCNFHIPVGIFHYRIWLVYSNDRLPQMPRSSLASKLDSHPLSFSIELSYTYSSSASVAWQSLLLALISIDGPLHCLLIRRLDAILSSFLTSLINLYHRILFHP